MKKIVIVLCFVLLLTTTLPFYTNAQNVENANVNEGEINFILDSPELSIYQYKKDNILYETHESVEKIDEKEKININVYRIDGENKSLVDNGTITISEITTDLIEVESENGETLFIDTSNPDVSLITPRAAYGGSYIADVRYRVFSNGVAEAIMSGQNPYYKNTKKNNSNFIRFQGHADGLKSKELDLATFGIASLADDIIKALKAGNLLSWTLIKKVVNGAIKIGPFGAALTLYQYGQDWLGARDYYRKI
ncbi:hypothetical protein ACIQYL_18310 [Lysinibacillus xylanilyticus]|uniref:hypothetical protein n=1 Tax=Lysinibacillus xylanilyticus TaxID=582475 RepID=UPI003829E6A4